MDTRPTQQCWIFSVTPENWEIVKAKNIWAVKTERIRDKVKGRDKLVFYLKRSKPPAFVGIYEVEGQWYHVQEPVWSEEIQTAAVQFPWQTHLKPVMLAAASYRDLYRNLRFVEKKQFWTVYIQGTPANMGRPISQEDFELILNEMTKNPITTQIAHAKEQVTKKTKPRETKQRGIPGHNELRDMIHEIGLHKGLVSEVEYPINDYRLDVMWRKPVRQTPDQVWEVHIGGNFYEALAKLKHAWDLWGSEPFLVTTEKYEQEARRLLGGTFHEIRDDMRIINWRKITELHRTLRKEKKLEKDIRLGT